MTALRAWALALLAVAIWLLCSWASQPHVTLVPASGNPAGFSAARAEAVLARVLGPERPHPVGSAGDAAVRGRILKELAMLGVPARTYTAFSCKTWRSFGYIDCATVTDIVAAVAPGRGKAIVMLAHYDSVPAGPGASDDGSGVAAVLESIRALKASREKSAHPIFALITDGEEAGLLGAKAFLDSPALRARVSAAVNVEARGTSGPSLLFQTSPGDSRLIDLYAAQVPRYATSSLYAEIYKFLPNDTDLTLFIGDGIPSLNFAFADNVRYYHSPRDTHANLSRATLQMQGDNLLGTVRGLERTGFAALKGGDDIYLSVFGIWLPRLPASWALPLSILVFVAIVFATWIARRKPAPRRRLLYSASAPLLLLTGSIALGFLLAFIAQLVSGRSDPTYAYPIAMRIALAFGLWGVALLVSRKAIVDGAAPAAWLWMAAFGIATAAFLPGVSPYFLFPCIVAAALLLAAARTRGGWSGAAGQVALLIAALAALVVWLALASGGEKLMGLRLHPLFTIPAAFALTALLPLLAARHMSGFAWRASVAFSFLVALGGAIAAGLLPTYSIASPQRLNLIYFENGRGPSRWIADTAWKDTATQPIPAGLKRAGSFQFNAHAFGVLNSGSAYTASAGAPRYPLPAAKVTSDRSEGSWRIVPLLLRGSAQTDAMDLRVPKQAKLTAIRIRGKTMQAPRNWSGDTTIVCYGRDCRNLAVTLALAGRGPVTIPFAERHYGLPKFGKQLAAARGAAAMPSQAGDGVLLADSIRLQRR